MLKRRLTLAAICAPATVPVLYFIAVLLGSGYVASSAGHIGKLVDEFFGALMPMSYLVSIGFGVPTVLALHRASRLNIKNCFVSALLLGFVLGTCSTYIFSGPAGYEESFMTRIVVGVVGVISAEIIAMVFCFIAGMPWNGTASFKGVAKDKAAAA